ncbi:hypothetical protein Pmani_027025 [Petrolisthes manimaculis]|uniref:Protein NATD1 n=1 Tax=Petrolisthes manimaculis TaxID=1843537 RepID=A0AAE1TXA1_9EUCA|nr:hypothetical protein Pmani_027025 [Petrolisthes manimaculis]
MGRDKAYLQYEAVNENQGGTGGGTVDLLHTVVPEAFRGQGVGKVLAKAAFEHFVNDRQQMKLTCWYLKKYYNDNQTQYQNHVIN